MAFRKFLFFLFFALFTQALCRAQSPGISWQKCLGGTGYDQVTDILQSNDGGYAVSIGSFKFRIVKLSDTGSIEWDKTYGGGAGDVAYCIAPKLDDGYIVTGFTKSFGGDVKGNHGGSDMWVLKLTAYGDIEWAKCYGGSGDEQGRYIINAPGGGYIVAGSTTSYDGDVTGRVKKTTEPDCDLWIIKIDDTGKLIWQKTYGGSLADAANCVQAIAGGGFIVVGDTYSSDGDVSNFHPSIDSLADMWVLKLNLNGDTIWERAYGGSQDESGTSIMPTRDGGFIAGGITGSIDGDVKSGTHGDDDGWIVRLTSAGNIVWETTVGGNNGDGIYTVDTTADGAFVVAGVEGSSNIKYNHGAYDYWILKMGEAGKIWWQKCLGGSKPDYGKCMARTLDNGYVMGGWAQSNDGDVSGNHGGFSDTWVVKLETDTIQPPQSVPNFNNLSAISVYPTCTYGTTQIINAENSSYIITDIGGKTVLQDRIHSAKQEINFSGLATGMYFLRITKNERQYNYKLVKL